LSQINEKLLRFIESATLITIALIEKDKPLEVPQKPENDDLKDPRVFRKLVINNIAFYTLELEQLYKRWDDSKSS
jgi:hypothetical protein